VAEVKRGLRRHAGFVVAASLMLTGLWVLSGADFFWPLIPMIFLFLSLKAHGRQVRYGNYQHGRYHGRERVAPWNAPG
jgi:hypothetical protein